MDSYLQEHLNIYRCHRCIEVYCYKGIHSLTNSDDSGDFVDDNGDDDVDDDSDDVDDDSDNDDDDDCDCDNDDNDDDR